MPTSPTRRTLLALRSQGMLCDIVERWLPLGNPSAAGGRKGYRRDMFHFADIVAVSEERGIVAIQCCGGNFAPHVSKVLGRDLAHNVTTWLRAGGKLEVWGWRKVLKKRGGKQRIWKARVREITLADFPPQPAAQPRPASPTPQ